MPETEQHGSVISSQPVADDFVLAYPLLRITLGINIALHGISRILAGPASFAAGLTKQFAGTALPHFAVQGFGYALPWLEAVIGLLVLLGAVTRVALVAGALLMAVLTFGSALHQDWDVAGLQLIYALVYFVLIGFRRYNGFSVDGFFNRPGRTQRH
jgi:thiosulfate dehydrogenase (quinone) large subunit